MIYSALLTVLSLSQTQVAPARVVEASLFKNGYSMVVREIKLDNDGETLMDNIPDAVYGTLWFMPSSGTKLDSVTNTSVKGSVDVFPSTTQAFLVINVGKDVLLEVRNGPKQEILNIEGTLVSASGNHIMVKSKNGVVTSLAVADVIRATVLRDPNVSTKSPTESRQIRIRSKGGGSVFIYAVQPGLSWTPNYMVDISDPKQMHLMARCTVVNDLAELKDATLRFVSGSPNIAYLGQLDPFTQIVAAFRGPGGGGGFAGGQVMQNVAAPGAAMMAESGRPFEEQTFEGEQIGDLYFYSTPKVNLLQTERAYMPLFEMKTPYEPIFSLTMGADEREGTKTVWRSLKFTNTGDKPLTSASALIVQDGKMTGQGSLSYTAQGQESLIQVSQALDVRAELQEEEIGRERMALRRPNDVTFDLVTVKGTLQLTNLRRETVNMRIKKYITGEVTQSGEAKSGKSALRLNQVNVDSMLDWTPKLEPGKVLKLTYTYKVYVQ